MKYDLKFMTIAVFAFIIGFMTNNITLSDINEYKIAVVDVQKVVANSSQVKKLKDEQQAKIKYIQIFVNNAKKAVANDKNETKKKS